MVPNELNDTKLKFYYNTHQGYTNNCAEKSDTDCWRLYN